MNVENLKPVQLRKIAKMIHEMEETKQEQRERTQEARQMKKLYKKYFERKNKNYKELVSEMISEMIHPDYTDETEDGLDEYNYISLAYHIDNALYMTIYDLVSHLKCLIKDI